MSKETLLKKTGLAADTGTGKNSKKAIQPKNKVTNAPAKTQTKKPILPKQKAVKPIAERKAKTTQQAKPAQQNTKPVQAKKPLMPKQKLSKPVEERKAKSTVTQEQKQATPRRREKNIDPVEVSISSKGEVTSKTKQDMPEMPEAVKQLHRDHYNVGAGKKSAADFVAENPLSNKKWEEGKPANAPDVVKQMGLPAIEREKLADPAYTQNVLQSVVAADADEYAKVDALDKIMEQVDKADAEHRYNPDIPQEVNDILSSGYGDNKQTISQVRNGVIVQRLATDFSNGTELYGADYEQAKKYAKEFVDDVEKRGKYTWDWEQAALPIAKMFAESESEDALNYTMKTMQVLQMQDYATAKSYADSEYARIEQENAEQQAIIDEAERTHGALKAVSYVDGTIAEAQKIIDRNNATKSAIDSAMIMLLGLQAIAAPDYNELKAKGASKVLSMQDADYLTDEEREVLAYYLAKDETLANTLYWSLADTLHMRKVSAKAHEWYDPGKDASALKRASRGIRYTASNTWQGLERGIRGMFNFFGRFVGVEMPQSEESKFEDEVLAFTAANSSKYWQALGSASQSIGNMLPSILAGQAVGALAESMPALGTTAASLKTGVASRLGYTTQGIGMAAADSMLSSAEIAKYASSFAMYASVKGNAIEEAMQNYGMTRDQAELYGTLNGISEVALQDLIGGIPAFGGIGANAALNAKIATINNSVARTVAHLGANLLGEEVEENLQNLLDPLFVTLITGADYDAPTLDEIIDTTLSTALMIGAMDVPDTVDYYKSAKLRDNLIDITQLRGIGNGEFDAMADVASEIIEQMDSGDYTVTKADIERMFGALNDGTSVAAAAQNANGMRTFVRDSEKLGADTEVYQVGQKVKQRLESGDLMSKNEIAQLRSQYGGSVKEMFAYEQKFAADSWRGNVDSAAERTARDNTDATVRSGAGYQAFSETEVFTDAQSVQYGDTLDALVKDAPVKSSERNALAKTLMSQAGADAVTKMLGVTVERASSMAEARARLDAAVEAYRAMPQERVETPVPASAQTAPRAVKQSVTETTQPAEATQMADTMPAAQSEVSAPAEASPVEPMRQEASAAPAAPAASAPMSKRDLWGVFSAITTDAKSKQAREASFDRYMDLYNAVLENPDAQTIDNPMSYNEFALRYKAQYPDATEFETSTAYEAYSHGLIEAPSEVSAKNNTAKAIKERSVEKKAKRIQEAERVAKLNEKEDAERIEKTKPVIEDKKAQTADIEKFKNYKEAGVVPNTAADAIKKNIRDAVDKFAKLLGVTVEYRNLPLVGKTAADKKANGWYDKETGHIVLDVAPAVASVYGDAQYLFVVAHEIGHAARDAMGARWSTFEKYAVAMMGGSDAVTAKQSESSVYADEAAAREDVACDFIGKILSKQNVLDAFLADVKVGKIGVAPVKNLVKAVRAIANKLTGGKVGQTGAEVLTAEIEKQYGFASPSSINKVADEIERVLLAVEKKNKADLLRKKNETAKPAEAKTEAKSEPKPAPIPNAAQAAANKEYLPKAIQNEQKGDRYSAAPYTGNAAEIDSLTPAKRTAIKKTNSTRCLLMGAEINGAEVQLIVNGNTAFVAPQGATLESMSEELKRSVTENDSSEFSKIVAAFFNPAVSERITSAPVTIEINNGKDTIVVFNSEQFGYCGFNKKYVAALDGGALYLCNKENTTAFPWLVGTDKSGNIIGMAMPVRLDKDRSKIDAKFAERGTKAYSTKTGTAKALTLGDAAQESMFEDDRSYSQKTKKDTKTSATSPLSGSPAEQGSVRMTSMSVTAAAENLDVKTNIAHLSDNVKSALVSFSNVLDNFRKKTKKAKDGHIYYAVNAENIEGEMIAEGLLVRGGSSESAYRTDGSHTLRVSKHSSNVGNFTTSGENLSVVFLKSNKTNDFVENENTNAIEAKFNIDYLNNHRDVAARLIKDMANFVVTGEYVPTAKAKSINISGTEEFKAGVRQRLGLDENNRPYSQKPVSPETSARYNELAQKYVSKTATPAEIRSLQNVFYETARKAGWNVWDVYHGTTQRFTKFDKSKANAEGNWGKGFYFTNNDFDAEINYGRGEGPDLKNKIETLADRLGMYDGYSEKSDSELRGIAKNMLDGGEEITLATALKMQNPVVLGTNGGEFNEETYFDYDDGYNAETEEYEDEPSGMAEDFVAAIEEELAENYERTNSQGAVSNLREAIMERAYDGGLSASELETIAREVLGKEYIEDEDGNYVVGEVIRAAFERMGFDGIVDNNVSKKFRNMDGLDSNTTHFIAFSPSQIKLADLVTYDDNGNIIPLEERFNPKNEDIRYSQKTYNINGVDKSVAWVDSNILSKRQKGEATDAYVQRYLTDKLRKDSYFLSLVESTGEEMYAEKRYRAPNQKVGLPGKYTHSDYNRDLKNNAPDIFRAKMRAAEVLGDIAAVSKYDKQSTTQDHSANKDAPGGVHYYNSTFVIPKFNSNMELVGVRAYDCRLIVDYGSDGKHHLYDIEKISRNEKLANAIFQKERQNAQNNSAPRNVSSLSADKVSIAQNAPNVNTQNAKAYSQKSGNGDITDPLARMAAQRRAQAVEDARNSKKYKEAAADVDEAKAKYDAAVAAEKANPTPRPVLSKAESDKLKAARQQYGTIPEGQNAARKADIPRKVSPDKKVSEFARTAAESKITNDTMLAPLKSLILEDGLSYTPDSNNAQTQRANEWYGSFTTADDAFRDWISNKRTNKDAMMRGLVLYNKLATAAQDAGTAFARDTYVRDGLQVLQQMQAMATDAGQALQLINVMKKMSPDHQLYLLQQSVRGLNEELENSVGKRRAAHVELNDVLVAQWLRAMKSKDQGYIDATEHQLLMDIAAQVPATFADKWNAWRYLCMLGNVGTSGRNLFGNIGMAATKNLSGNVQAAVEAVASVFSKKFREYNKQNGTQIFMPSIYRQTKQGKATMKYARALWDTIADKIDNNKYDDKSMKSKMEQAIREKNAELRILPERLERIDLVRQWQKFTEWLLNGEVLGDSAFLRYHFTRAFTSVCAKRGITAEMLNSGRVSQEDIAKIQQFAIREAQEATFHDINVFSQAVSNIRIDPSKAKTWSGKVARTAGNAIIEGAIPFKKTPANVLVRALEYGPVGLLKAISADVVRVSKGELTVNKMLQNFSRGLTGTALAALGYMLKGLDILHGSEPDDDEEREGVQGYSITIGDKNITLDWLAPAAVPMFMGAMIREAIDGTAEKNGDKNDAFDIAVRMFSDTMAPIMEMSMMSGFQDMLSMAFSSDGSIDFGNVAYALTINNAFSYLSQAIPTLSSQLAQTLEPTAERTYVGDIASPLTRKIVKNLVKIAEKIPGMNWRQQPYVDEWGRTESNGNVLERFFNAFINPAYVSDVNITDVDREIADVEAMTGDNLQPSARGYTITVKEYDADGEPVLDENGTQKSEQVRLNGEQYTRYATAYGKEYAAMLGALFTSKAYADMTATEKSKAISDVEQIANEYGKLAADVGYKVDSDKLFDLVDAGIPIEEAYAAKIYRSTLDSDKELSASQQMQMYDNYIQNVAAAAGWTDEQKALVLEKYGTFFSQVPGSIGKYSGVSNAVGDSDIALDISNKINALKPYGGKDDPADWQKWEVISTYPGLSEKQKYDALYAYMLNQDGNETDASKAFKAAHNAGVTTAQYVGITKKVGQLKPVNGNKEVSDKQKFEAVIKYSGLSDKQQAAMLHRYMKTDQEAKFDAAHNEGVTSKMYIEMYLAKDQWAGDQWSKAEVKAYLSWLSKNTPGGLTQQQYAALYNAFAPKK